MAGSRVEEQALVLGAPATVACSALKTSRGRWPTGKPGALELSSTPTPALGVHAAFDGAGDVLVAATYAIEFGLTVDDLADTRAPNPTMAEALRITAGLFRSNLPTS